MRASVLLIAAVAAVVPASVRAQSAEDADLDLIPDAIMAPTPDAPAVPAAFGGDTRTNLYLEIAPQAPLWRSSAIAGSTEQPDWRSRASLDLRLETRLGEDWKATFADRMDLVFRDGRDPEWNDLRNSLKEAYLTWSPDWSPTWISGGHYLDLGRVNVRNGVAQGFNPTDWFKADSVIVRTSEDPSVLREIRLGTVMARGQTVWDGGSATALFAPKLANGDGTPNMSAFAPGFDRTNRQNRGLVKTAVRIAEDFSPELLLFKADAEPVQIGANLTRGIGDSVIAYAEWAGGRSHGLVERAFRNGRRTGSLRPSTPSVLPVDTELRFRSQAALGLSWTSAINLTVSLEYHYNGAGLDRGEWRSWTDRAALSAAAASQFRLITGHAREAQEPVTRDSLFVRASWPDAVVDDLDLTALARLNPYDGSVFGQFDAAWYLSNIWTAGLTLTASVGDGKSEYGIPAQKGSVQVRLVRYF
jgi:hypothetical protein